MLNPRLKKVIVTRRDLCFLISLVVGFATARQGRAQSSFYTGSDLDHATGDSNDDEVPWISHQHHRQKRHSHKLWSGSLGLTLARCLHRTNNTYVDVIDEPSEQLGDSVPCSPTTDTESRVGPPNTGLSLDGSIAYALTRRWSLSASLSYEPAPGALIPELAATFTQVLTPALDWIQELSATSLYAHGETAPPVPEILRLSEGLVWDLHGFQLSGDLFAELGFGAVTPLLSLQRPRPPSALYGPSLAYLGLPNANSLTLGFSIDGEKSLTKSWAAGVGFGASARRGADALDSPPTMVDATPCSLIWRHGPWTDTGAVTLTSAHLGGLFNLAVEVATQRDF